MNTQDQSQIGDILPSLDEQFPTRVDTLVAVEQFMESIDAQLLAGKPYRPTQKEAALLFHQWIGTALDRPDLRGRVVKPMGTGKTGFAIIMSEMVGGKTLFVADTNANGEQAAREYEAHYSTLPADKKKSVGRYFGSNQEIKSDITISGFWMEEKWMKNIDWSQMRLVIVDEADINGLSKKRAELIIKIAQEYGIPVVGMSATEEQMSGRELKDVFPDSIYRLPMPGSLPMCRKLRLIPHTSFHDVLFEGTLAIDREMLQQRGEIDDNVIREFTKSNQWNRQIIEHYLRNGDKPQGLVVFRTNVQVDDFISEAKQRGIRAMRFTGQESQEELNQIREAFERGKVDLLVGSRLLGRGLNLPKIRVIYNSTITYSPQVFWQVNGRALRNEEGALLSHRDVYAVLPKSVKDEKTGASVFMEEMPLSNSAFFSRAFFSDDLYLSEKRSGHINGQTFDIDKLPVIRAISEVMSLVKGRRAKPEGFESKATQAAKVLEHLRETKMDMRICRMIQYMRSERRINILRSLEDLDKNETEEVGAKPNGDPLKILANFAIELTLREEISLVSKMRKGIPLNNKSKNPDKNSSEVVRDAYRAREILLRAHLKLIAACAKMYVNENFEYDDLFQEGVKAFLRALDKIEPGRGRVVNFCIYEIYRKLQRYVENSNSLIRIPVNVHESSKGMTREDIAGSINAFVWAILREDEQDVYVRYREDKHQIWPSERDLLTDEEKSPFDAAADGLRNRALRSFLEKLTPRENKIIEMRFGIGEPNEEVRTLEEIGVQFGVEGARIYQIEAKALRWLRHENRAKTLRPYW